MESTRTATPSQEEKGISLKEVILRVREYIKFLWSKWLVIILASILGAGLGLTFSFIRKPSYVAELTFVLEDNKMNPLGAYAGLASQFMGIDLGGGGGVFSGDNIIEFLQSRLMIEKSLLAPVTYEGKKMTLAGLYIDMNELRDSWRGEKQLENINFIPGQERNNFSLQQDSVLKVIYTRIVEKDLHIEKPNKELNFVSVKCETNNETFSKNFTERLVDEAIDFYVQTRLQRSKVVVDRLQSKADSIELLLNRKTYSVAASQDLNLNPARSVASVNTELAARDKLVLQTIYAEVIKNLEISKMTMAQETPIIQIVDTPIFPLEKNRLGKVKGLAIGLIIGGFLAVLWLILHRLYKEVLSGKA